MLRSRLKKVIFLRSSGYQSKWNMLKYRTNVEEYPYHQEQFHIDEDIDFSYLLPKDHPEYKPPGEALRSELSSLSEEEIEEKYPEFLSWAESWLHNYENAFQTKDYDEIPQIDAEREEEKHNFDLRTRRKLINPLKTMNMVQRDMWEQKLEGVTKAEELYHDENGEKSFPGKSVKSINLLYENSYDSEDILNEPIGKQKWHGNQLASKGFALQVDQEGETNYKWASLWPTHRSFTDSIVPFDVRAGHKRGTAQRPDKNFNSQLNHAPNLLHLSPPVVKAHCAKLKKFATKFPEEYKADFAKMREDFPIEIQTTSKCVSAPYQQSSNNATRWATLLVNFGQLGLTEHQRRKFEVFVNGRPDEGVTKRLYTKNSHAWYGSPRATYRDRIAQDYRMGEDKMVKRTGMVKLESARCPLKSQNEGYLIYLLEEYWSQARKVFKAENRGELKHGKFTYSRSRAKKRLALK
ncbi:unnamed protein product [Oikopleura dioica]|uniref:Uncharacterized protein n=1 Tax=Oikopleura dioica TaxID=34765 RepID=E4WS70_OIKDI|nr:unnamed protein product [Oikopleura dioica]